MLTSLLFLLRFSVVVVYLSDYYLVFTSKDILYIIANAIGQILSAMPIIILRYEPKTESNRLLPVRFGSTYFFKERGSSSVLFVLFF